MLRRLTHFYLFIITLFFAPTLQARCLVIALDSAELLYWKGFQSGLDYTARRNIENLTYIVRDTPAIGHIIYSEYDWEAGVRLNFYLGERDHCYPLQFRWTHCAPQTTSRAKVKDPEKEYLSTYLMHDRLVREVTGAEEAINRLDVDYDTLDLLLSSYYCDCGWTGVNFLGGGRVLFWDQHIKTTYKGVINSLLEPTGVTAFARTKQDLWAAGLYGAAQGKCCLGCGFQLRGHL